MHNNLFLFFTLCLLLFKQLSASAWLALISLLKIGKLAELLQVIHLILLFDAIIDRNASDFS